MFVDNKYTQWYYALIDNARNKSNEGYTEEHHIIPKSLGGIDAKDNLVDLTAREHFVAHRFLVKMTTGKEKSKMAYALHKMTFSRNKHQQRLFTAAQYETVRKIHSENNPMKDPKIAKKISQIRQGVKQTKEHTQNHADSISLNWKVTNPQGKSFLIRNMSQFCRKNKLDRANLHNVAIGKYTQHKGWKCERVA